MKRYTTYLASCAILALGTTVAQADCAAELAQLTGEDVSTSVGAEGASGETGPSNGEAIIPKDGSTAPLSTDDPTDPSAVTGMPEGAGEPTGGETSGDMAAGGSADDEITKDASTAPLEEASDAEVGVPESSESAAIATSRQSAQAQQEGDLTAEARANAIERAEAALAEGDEEACMEAMEELRG